MKKLLALILCICVLFSFESVILAAESNNAFTDVDANSSVGKDIYKLFNAGIINGNGDGTFTPYNPVTRAELCKMVNNICGFTAASSSGFTDVTSDKWYYTHVLIGKQAGYINGFPDGSFRGDDYITREQVCAIICRAFGIYDLGVAVDIKDEVSAWAREYVNALVSNKLISLEEGNTFRATENMKRGELSSSLANFVSDTPAVTPPPEGGSSTGGSSSGGSSGGSSRPNRPGGNTGGSTGGNSGDSTGGNTGDSTGGNTGDSTGGNTGDSTGGNTGDSTGGNTGDSTGGNAGGSTGGNTDGSGSETTPPDDTFDNSEVEEYLNKVVTEIWDTFVGEDFTETEYLALDPVYEAIDLALKEVDNVELSKEFIRTTYAPQIALAKSRLKAMSDKEQESFGKKLIIKLNGDTRLFLEDYFDIKISVESLDKI